MWTDERDDPAKLEMGGMGSGADVIVLGAGMVGVSVALHLQRRGRDVVLIDRRDAGEETSYGNAGLIQREAVIPYTFPREFGTILSYAMNHRRDAVYHLSALPRLAPWLFRYWQNAAPDCVEHTARALAPLMAQCVAEHDALSPRPAPRRNGSCTIAAGSTVSAPRKACATRSRTHTGSTNMASTTRCSPAASSANSNRTCPR